MSIETVLYLINFLSNVDTALAIISSISLIIFIGGILYITNANANEEEMTLVKKWTFRTLILFLSFLILLIFIPNERTMYLMVGSHYLKESKIPTKVEEAINKKLDEYLKDDK